MRGRFLASLGMTLALLSCAHTSGYTPDCNAALLPHPLDAKSLKRKVTFEEAEKAHMVDGVSFGALHEQWMALRASAKPGDELWLYTASEPPAPNSNPQSTFALGGQEGYILMRGCTPVDRIVTLIA